MPQIDQLSAIAIQSELMPGESIVWAGQPKKAVIFHKEDACLIPFSLLWGGFAIFWEASVMGIWGTRAHSQWMFGMLWGIPFVLIGQYMIWGRFFYATWLKGRTNYAVTNRRVIVTQDGWSGKWLRPTLTLCRRLSRKAVRVELAFYGSANLNPCGLTTGDTQHGMD